MRPAGKRSPGISRASYEIIAMSLTKIGETAFQATEQVANALDGPRFNRVRNELLQSLPYEIRALPAQFLGQTIQLGSHLSRYS